MGRLRGAVAHDVSLTPRTVDVVLPDSSTFADMLLSQRTLTGLLSAGFRRPSPIQRSAIPLGRCGTDLIVQAKSGTGKTLVFGIVTLEMLDLSIPQLQVVILAPTREIAMQIKEVLLSIASGFPGLQVAAFIGGLPLSMDVAAANKCHVAVGTPGRVKQLVARGSLRLRSVRLFVLDEADRLVDKSFCKDVNFIFSKLPENKQTLVVSATFPPELEQFLTGYLVHPRRVCPSADTLLLGLRQFVAVTKFHTSALVCVRNKTSRLLQILSSFSFRQCLVFCNLQTRMEGICRDLASRGWPALHLAGSMPQKERLAVVAALQNQRCRVLLSTDLASRGVDAEQVDLVVNLDLPYDTETYLHRIGRAGRFGASGVAVSVLSDGEELVKFRHMLFDIGGVGFNVSLLPNGDLPVNVWTNNASLSKVEGLQRTQEKSNGFAEDQFKGVEKMKNEPQLHNHESFKEVTGKISGEKAIEILRSHFIKMPQVVPLSFAKLTEMFNSLDANLPIIDPLQDAESSKSQEQLELALKCLRISDFSINEHESGDISKQNNHTTDEITSRISDNSDSEEGAFCESKYLEKDEYYGTDYSEDTNSDSYLCSDEEVSCATDEIGVGNTTENSVNAEGCSVCSSWFTEWRNKLALKRQLDQAQLYMLEMLK